MTSLMHSELSRIFKRGSWNVEDWAEVRLRVNARINERKII